MNRVQFLFLLSLLLFANKSVSQVDQTTFDFENTKRILTEEISRILEETGIPSISFSLILEDTIIWSEAFGFANVKKRVPASRSTVYSTGSCFKFVTATAIMQLAESGKLDIDDSINKYLEEYAIDDLSSDGTPVTFRHLLSHHSGLKGPIEIVPIWEKKMPKSLAKIASEISAEEAPGVNYKYCNHCYALAGLAVEKISGQSFEDYIVEHILSPLQIESKGPIVPTPSMVEELALPYAIKNNQAIPEYQYRFDVFPAGDIYLTSWEMANFLIAQLNEGSFNGQSILNPNSISEMQEPQFESTYGLGTGILEDEDSKFLQHTGEVPGFSTFFKVETTSKTGIYIASNANGVHDVLKAIADLSLKLMNGEMETEPILSFARKEFEKIQLVEEVLEKYTGKYQLTPEVFLNVTLEDARLFGQVTGQSSFELFAYEEDKFFLEAIYAQIHFNTKNQKVTSLTLFQNENTEWIKVE